MFQEFQLSVTPLGHDQYLVRTERVASGVTLAEVQVHWDVESWLQEAGRLMDDPMSRLLQGGKSLETEFLFITGQMPTCPSSEEGTISLMQLGQKLYDALFQGPLRDSWMMAQAIAHNQRSVLRFRLGLKGSRLLRLPWEVLHGGSREMGSEVFRPLATGPDITFSRYQMGIALGNQGLLLSPKPQGPVRVLMAIASPEDQDSLELHQEALQLQAELQRNLPHIPPNLELTLLEQPGRTELTQALEQGNYQVFHYAGHSNLGESGGDVYLVSRTTGLTEKLFGEDLAGLLVNNGIQLAVFNSCRGTDTALNPSEDNQKNLAQSLVNRGIPAVVAMAERIPDEVALTFTRLFYRNLDQGYPIDLSLSRARQGLISAYGSNQLYWALPVLYLHPNFDGVLIPSAEQTAPDPFDFDDLDDFPLGFLAGDASEDEYDEDLEEEEDEFLAPRSSLAEMSEEADDDFLSTMEEEEDLSFIKDMLSEPSPEEEEDLSFIKDMLSEPSSEDLSLSQDRLHEPSSEEIGVGRAESPVGAKRPPERGKSAFPIHLSRPLMGLLGSFAAMFLMFGGVVWIWLRIHHPALFSQFPTSILTPDQPLDPESLDLEAVSTEKLTSFAIAQLNDQNIELGAIAVETLLDRNVLSHAASVLSGTPVEQRDNPQILFLFGRLAWQSVQTGDPNYAISDARRYWETAVKKDPKNVQYHNALGFAYYAEGNYNQANQAWYDALALTDTATETPAAPIPPETLETYAGLGLGLQKLAESQTGNTKTTLLNKAYKLRQTVLNENPLAFQAEKLSQNWLWTEQAIQDWQQLAVNHP